jgi:hypothetical protein
MIQKPMLVPKVHRRWGFQAQALARDLNTTTGLLVSPPPPFNDQTPPVVLCVFVSPFSFLNAFLLNPKPILFLPQLR